jgi:hypothetical protein
MTNSDKRLFTFGCSFTKYVWPTWATIVGQEFLEFENWGCVGAGNMFIFNALVEASITRNISSDDTVMIMWSSMPREDRYKNNRWLCPGNIYNQTLYSQGFVDKFADLRGFYIRDLALIHSAKMILEKIGCKYNFMSMIDISNPWEVKKELTDSDINDLLDQYKDTLSVFKPSVHEVIFNFDWWSRPYTSDKELKKIKKNYEEVAGIDWPSFDSMVTNDFTNVKKQILDEIFDTSKWNWKNLLHNSKRINFHPTPIEHLEYVQKVLPEINLQQSTVDIIEQIDVLLRSVTSDTMHDQPHELLASKLKQSPTINRW